MLTTYSYRTIAHWTEHKRGIVEAENIPRTINFAAPPEFGGEPGLWTPEHLLLAAVSTCYVATLRAVAEASKIEFHALELTVEGTIEKQDGGFRFTRMLLRPAVVIEKEEERERMGRLLEKAERVCLISRSLSCTMRLEPKILVQEQVHA
jgi:peroxiredoxin-like protein